MGVSEVFEVPRGESFIMATETFNSPHGDGMLVADTEFIPAAIVLVEPEVFISHDDVDSSDAEGIEDIVSKII